MKLGQEDEQRFLKHRKLALLVDLDQTLIHTTNDNIPANLKVRLDILRKTLDPDKKHKKKITPSHHF